MTRVYRILRKRFSRNAFDGEGAFLFGGRWSSPGTRVVYTSEHLSLAMLEYFVHLDPSRPPRDLITVTAEIPARVSRRELTARELPARWRTTPAPASLARFGDDFVNAARSAILIVPSALAPDESNWLLNPQHPDFAYIRMLPGQPFHYDSRLFH